MCSFWEIQSISVFKTAFTLWRSRWVTAVLAVSHQTNKHLGTSNTSWLGTTHTSSLSIMSRLHTYMCRQTYSIAHTWLVEGSNQIQLHCRNFGFQQSGFGNAKSVRCCESTLHAIRQSIMKNRKVEHTIKVIVYCAAALPVRYKIVM